MENTFERKKKLQRKTDIIKVSKAALFYFMYSFIHSQIDTLAHPMLTH